MLLSLTQAGKRKAKDIHARGAESSFLVSLSQEGPSTLSDVAADLRIPTKAASKVAKRLIQLGYIRQEA